MDRKNRQRVIQGAQRLLKIVTLPFEWGSDGLDMRVRTVLGRGAFECHILDSDYERFIELFQDVLADEPTLQERFTLDEIAIEFGCVIGRLLREQTPDVNTALQAMYDRARQYKSDQTVYMPLGGISMQGDSVQLGPVTIVRFTNEMLDQLSKQIAPLASLVSLDILGGSRTVNTAGLENAVFAEFHVTASPDRAHELAEEAVSEVFDIIQFAVASSMPLVYGIRVGPKWLSPVSWHVVPIVNQNTGEWILQSKRTGPIFPLSITSQTLETWKDLGVFDMLDLLVGGESVQSQFDRTLVRSIRWCSRASIQESADDAVLGFFVSLETLFTSGDKSQPIANAVAEGLAFLLGNDYAERSALKAQVKRLYDIRSAITHGREGNDSRQAALELKGIATKTLLVLLKRRSEFSVKMDLLNWIEIQRLS